MSHYMQIKSRVCLILTIFCTSLFSVTNAAQPANMIAPNFSNMLQKVMPAVVNIAIRGEVTVVGTASDDQRNDGSDTDQPPAQYGPPIQGPNGEVLQPIQRQFEGLGSGVVVDPKHGYIITNAHVINQAKTITVTLSDGRKLPAKLIGSDPLSDLAVLQIKADNLKSIVFTDSDNLKIGEPVAAIGNPFGLNQTVTSGIISGLQRSNLHIENYENFIQTDASINPGNSGGALVNMDGQLIGINTAILTPAGGNIGIGFAIPANMVRGVMAQLIEYGAVKRGLMGVIVNDVTPELAHAFHIENRTGALIAMITPGSPASKAGLQPGDIITKVNGRAIKDATEVRNSVGLLRVGSDVKLDILRNNKTISMNITTADPEQYQKENAEKQGALFGVDVQDFNQLLASQGHIKGAIVVGIKPDTPAWRAGLRPGDVIVSANRMTVSNIADLLKAADSDKSQLLLNILRSTGALFIVVK